MVLCPRCFGYQQGYAVYLGPNLIAWRSKKQPTISKSSTEAEYNAFGYTVTETIWIRKLLYDIGIMLRDPLCLYCDNINATYMYAKRVQHDRSKNIVLDYHFVWERAAAGDLFICYIPTRMYYWYLY